MMSKRKKFQIKKCSVTKKTMFTTEDKANRAKMRIWSHDPSADIMDLHSYLCEHCGKWHVGHISYYEKVLENAQTS